MTAEEVIISMLCLESAGEAASAEATLTIGEIMA